MDLPTNKNTLLLQIQALTKRQLSVCIVAGLMLVGISALAYQFFWKARIAVITVARGSFVQTIVASGHVASPNRINIGAQITGTVSEVQVIEGQFVQQGQTLISLENSEAQSALQQAQASEQQALSSLRQLRELKAPVAVETQIQAQANLANAKNNLTRSIELFNQGFIGAAAKDEAERAFQVAQAQLTIGQRQTDSLQPGGSEIALALATWRQTQAAVGAALARLRYSTIQAPKSGTLIARSVEVGDGVQPSKVLMVLSPQGSTQLVLQIDEKNIKWLRLNQLALASADAFPEKKFQAQLVYINPSIDPQRGSVEVKLNVRNPPLELKQDMTVSVDIEASRIDNTLMIPLAAVHGYETHRPWVWVIRNGVAYKQAVDLGLESQGVAQLLSGLEEGDTIAHNVNSLREGSHVRVLAP